MRLVETETAAQGKKTSYRDDIERVVTPLEILIKCNAYKRERVRVEKIFILHPNKEG